MGVGDRDGPADHGHAPEVVDVVSHVGDAGEVDVLAVTPPGERGRLVVDGLHRLHHELRRPGRDDGVGLARDDEEPDARAPEQRHAHPVGPARRDELGALRRQVHAVVGVHPVEVRHDEVDVEGTRPVEHRREEPGESEVVGRVDVDGREIRHLGDADPAEEAVPRLQEPRAPHHVERARLLELRLEILSAGPECCIVVDAGRARVRMAPEEGVRALGREHHVALILDDPRDRGVEVRARDERRGRLDEDHQLRREREYPDGVQEGRLGTGAVPGQLSRPVDDDGARGTGGCGDPLVVRTHVDGVDQVRRPRGGDGARDQRDPADRGEVLAGDARGPSACGDDRHDHRGHA